MRERIFWLLGKWYWYYKNSRWTRFFPYDEIRHRLASLLSILLLSLYVILEDVAGRGFVFHTGPKFLGHLFVALVTYAVMNWVCSQLFPEEDVEEAAERVGPDKSKLIGHLCEVFLWFAIMGIIMIMVGVHHNWF